MKSILLATILAAFLTTIEKQFYKAFQGDSSTAIEEALATIEQDGNSNRNTAYKGALLTKKASYAKSPLKKLSVFKEGAKLLDQAIAKDGDNAEYRFLRLVIQEKAPALLGYNKDKATDKAMVEKQFSQLSSALQAYIKAYAKEESSILDVNDL